MGLSLLHFCLKFLLYFVLGLLAVCFKGWNYVTLSLQCIDNALTKILFFWFNFLNNLLSPCLIWQFVKRLEISKLVELLLEFVWKLNSICDLLVQLVFGNATSFLHFFNHIRNIKRLSRLVRGFWGWVDQDGLGQGGVETPKRVLEAEAEVVREILSGEHPNLSWLS